MNKLSKTVDKTLHFIVGFVISLIIFIISIPFDYINAPTVAFLAVLSVSIVKEVYDIEKRSFSFKDVFFTLFGWATMCLVTML